MPTAVVATESWHITRRGFWRRVVQANDASDMVVGEFGDHELAVFDGRGWAGGGATAAGT